MMAFSIVSAGTIAQTMFVVVVSHDMNLLGSGSVENVRKVGQVEAVC